MPAVTVFMPTIGQTCSIALNTTRVQLAVRLSSRKRRTRCWSREKMSRAEPAHPRAWMDHEDIRRSLPVSRGTQLSAGPVRPARAEAGGEGVAQQGHVPDLLGPDE